MLCAGTWTRLPDYDSSNGARRPSTAVDADAAAAVASQRLESSGWPPILTRALSGRLLLKLHSGPANPQGVAGVEVRQPGMMQADTTLPPWQLAQQ